MGSTTWHTHDDQDETFLLLRGRLTVQLRTGDVHLEPGDLLVGPDVTSDASGGKPAWSHAPAATDDADQQG